LFGVGGILLEAARRRAALAAELRFSASVRDLRTVVLLRRQLASERPRRRPWLHLRSGGVGRFPVWRRGLQSVLRWPLARVVRVAAIGITAGAVAAGAWSAAPIALFIPGGLLFVAALDLVEPLAQESDHPTRLELLPLASSTLISRHLAAPAAGLGIVLVLGVATAAAIGGSPATALGVGAVILTPCALLLACCAAFSATADPYANVLGPPEAALAAAAAPLLGAVVAVGVPLLIARETARHGNPAAIGALAAAIPLAAVAAILVPVLGFRFSRRGALAG
jgi:hypothetical protein